MSTDMTAPAAVTLASLRRKIGPIGFGRQLFGVIATLVAVAAVLRTVGLTELLSAARALATSPSLLALFLVSYTGAFALRAIAWGQLLPGLGWPALFRILQAANLANHLLPVKAGEVLRGYLAVRRGVRPSDALASTIVARWVDFSALLLIASVLLPVTARPWAGIWALLVPAIVVLAIGIGLLLLRASAPRFPRSGRARALVAVDALRQSLHALGWGQLIRCALCSLSSWLLEGVAVWAAAAAVQVDVTLPAASAVTAFTILFQTLHVTPGGLGVYELSMAGALAAHGVPWHDALILAALAHAAKFAYAFTLGTAWTLHELASRAAVSAEGNPAGVAIREASRFEIVAARLWNVVNEGKPFTPVFVLGVLVLLSVPRLSEPGYWWRSLMALLALVPLFLIFYRYDFPLWLRAFLWLDLAAFFALFRYVDPLAIAAVLVLYLGFTVGLWGTVYYHLRMGAPWTNFLRFWRLVLENPDATSGNFLEQVPKTLLLVLIFRYLVSTGTWRAVAGVEAFIAALGVLAVLVHQWFFTWAPAAPRTPTRVRNTEGRRICRRFILIVIDGCRADRLRQARTPFLDRLRREGTEFTDMRTVYPARSVTCFSSMLTGAPPTVHGIRSNFVPRLGVRCDSIFTALRRNGLRGRLVGIAHLIDAFGEEDVRTVTSVRRNEEIDLTLIAQAQRVLEQEDPDLLVVQLLSVDQTGHARGSYYPEYLERIEATDRVIEAFLRWCAERGYLEDATVMINADHGQGIGIGGHGHLSPGEVNVPCILWGKGVPQGVVRGESCSILDVAPTISYFLGIEPPAQSVGQVLLAPGHEGDQKVGSGPVAVIIPAYNEAANLPHVLERIPRHAIPDLHVIVVDDGSTDETAAVARRSGADQVICHPRNLGLGAAVRTGIAAALACDARAAVYLDSDGEYDPAEIPVVLGPVLRGEADYVLGSRYRGSRDGQPWLRLIANLVFTSLLCVMAGRLITDGQTGFRAFSRRALEVAEIIHDYNYAQVLTLDLLRKGMRLAEVPITYRYRGHGRSFIRARYLWKVPWAMVRELLSD